MVLKIPSRNLKKAGLSRQKISYLKNIAKSFKKKSLLSKINNLSYDGLLSWEIAYKNRIN